MAVEQYVYIYGYIKKFQFVLSFQSDVIAAPPSVGRFGCV